MPIMHHVDTRQPITHAFAQWLELRVVAGFSVHTVTNYRHALDLFTASQGDLPVGDVTREHVKAWVRGFGDLAPSTVSGRLSAMSSFYDDLVLDEIVTANPFRTVRRPRRKARSIRRPAPRAALDQVMPAATHRERAMLALAAHMGLRRFEIAKVNTADIDWNERQLSVVGKGGRPAVLPIPPSVVVHLQVWITVGQIPPGGWLFPGRRGGPLSAQRCGEIITAVSVRAGVRVTPHQWRHRVGTDLAESHGVKVAQELLRHASSSTTDRYVHMDPVVLRRALEDLDRVAA